MIARFFYGYFFRFLRIFYAFFPHNDAFFAFFSIINTESA